MCVVSEKRKLNIRVMMPPDFNKATTEALAKRAGYLCSNPDCRVSTVGPKSDPSGATTIGEAAHISGARPSSARYSSTQNDVLRADITNGIWLCRNCHKTVDADETKFPENLLLHWRELHENYVSERLGRPGDEARRRVLDDDLLPFRDKPPIIRRLLIDKPLGWEWRLTAELLRHYNTELFEKLEDLRNGHYLRPSSFLDEASAAVWIDQRISEMQEMFGPVDGLLKRLTASWGPPGQSADVSAMDRACVLIRDWLEQVVLFEETIRFTNLPKNFERLQGLLRDIIGSQAKKLEELPSELDGMVAMIGTDHGGTEDNPLIVRKTIEVTLPDNWSDQFGKEYEKVASSMLGRQQEEISDLVRPFRWLFFLAFFLVAFVIFSSILNG